MRLNDWFRGLKYRRRVKANLAELSQRAIKPRAHGLDRPLVVSLTSYPPRFAQLALAIRCLLSQSVAPDAVVLWVAEADLDVVPEDVRALENQGLTICGCDDLKSYKKLVPALMEEPDRYIVTADDDVYFGPHWLEDLVKAAHAFPGRVIGHRAHRIQYRGEQIGPYSSWKKNIDGAVEGRDVFATGVGGILYPPHVLHPMATDHSLFLDLCPSADDIWFYWMTRHNQRLVRHVGPKTRVIEWPGSQHVSLRAVNHGAGDTSGNDQALTRLVNALPLPD